MLELGQIPSGLLDNDVVKRGLKVGSSGLGDRIGERREGVPETNLGRSVSKRVTSGLGGKSRRSGETGVDLDNAVVQAIRLQGVLDVALSDNAKVTDNLDGSGSNCENVSVLYYTY